MTIKSINNITLRLLVENGGIRALSVVGTDGGWILKVKYGLDEYFLASNARPVRLFKKLDTLVMYLKKIGINQFNIDSSGYFPPQEGASRPDRSTALKQIHEAAAEHVKYSPKSLGKG
ncbi:hypothetical protein ACMV5I_27435 [Serratia sp. T13T92]|uniref:hypothetical protein n=1 Tax=Serratia sp. T13T92 TaxID=3397496 RepID=UPI0039E093ED